jgi:FkbM family methyltransferase
MISSTTGKDGVFYGYEKDYIFECIKTHGRFSPTEIVFLENLLEENDNVIEIGSNIGSHTIPFAKKIKNGTCFVFEPQNDIYQMLSTNILVNQLQNVRTYPVGIGMTNNIIYYTKDKSDTNTGGFTLLRNSEPVGTHFLKITPINSTLYPEFYNLKSLKLIKIDVEGMELFVLHQLLPLMKTFKPYIFVEYNFQTYHKLINFAYDNKYIPYLFNTNCTQYGLQDKYADINIFFVPENDDTRIFSYLHKLERNSPFLLNITVQ